MKKGIHPKYYPEAKVICACGNTWTTGSTQEEIHTEMCSVCHPFFTGEQRIVDTAGQVDRFQRRKERADKMAEASTRRRIDKGKKGETLFEFITEEEKPSLQEALQAEFPDVAAQVAAADSQPAAQTAAPAPAEEPRRAPRKPRERKPREAAGKEAAPKKAARPKAATAAPESSQPAAEAKE